MAANRPPLRDPICGRTPSEIRAYDSFAREWGMTNDEYVWHHEGTLDVASGYFTCDACYAAIGEPAARFPDRWTAKPENVKRFLS